MSTIQPPSTDLILCRVNSAILLLAEARDATDAKKVADLARAAEVYARRQKMAEEVIASATAVRIDAMTLMGEFLKATEKRGPEHSRGGGSKGSHREPLPDSPPTLAECGISRKDSSAAQALVDIREKAPEIYDRVRAGEVTVSAARADVRRQEQSRPAPADSGDPCCTVDDIHALVATGNKFGCIYADPPWQYGNQGTRAATDNHYTTMTIDDIAALPVSELAAEKCHLHLWTTNAFLEPALILLRGWGFEFKSTFVWVKPQLGIGNYWRCSHELMLLGVKGGLTFPPSGVKSWLEADRTGHSAKPEAVRELVEQMSPAPRLELFGRRVAPGWTVWGNEIRRSLFDPAVTAAS